jgi:hypothetical protein
MKKLLSLMVMALLVLSTSMAFLHVVSAQPGQDEDDHKSMPVGGYDVPPNYLAVLLELVGPWIIAAAASAAVIAVVVKKLK